MIGTPLLLAQKQFAVEVSAEADQHLQTSTVLQRANVSSTDCRLFHQ